MGNTRKRTRGKKSIGEPAIALDTRTRLSPGPFLRMYVTYASFCVMLHLGYSYLEVACLVAR